LRFDNHCVSKQQQPAMQHTIQHKKTNQQSTTNNQQLQQAATTTTTRTTSTEGGVDLDGKRGRTTHRQQ